MLAAEHAVGGGEGCGGVVDDLVVAGGVGFLVPDVQVIAAHESDPQHYFGHDRSLGVLVIGRHAPAKAQGMRS